MKDTTGEELIAQAGTIALLLSRCMDVHELGVFTELLGLVKHNLEIIKIRRFLNEKKPEVK